MWYVNNFTEKLGISYPIIQAGMAGGVTTPELVAAVSNAGGLGTLGAGYMKANQVKEAIQQIKNLTDQPFAVNLFVPEKVELHAEEIEKANELLSPYREALQVDKPEVKAPNHISFKEQVEVIIEEKVDVCSFTFGLPSPAVINRLQAENIILIGTATTVNEARLVEKQGLDMVVMQGSEAGGHRGTFATDFSDAMIGTMSLVPQTVDHVKIPVIAAGGIMDGRGVLAALTLGAQAVQMGTCFVTAVESDAKPLHIDALLNSTEEETVVTSVISGKPARGIRNEFIEQMTPFEAVLPGYPILNSLTSPIRAEAAKQKRPEWIHLWSGQSPRLSQRIPAKAMIDQIIAKVNQLSISG